MLPENFKPLVVGISSRALFDTREENAIYEAEGEDAYRAYQRAHRKVPMKPGTAFEFVRKLLTLNEPNEKPRVEIVLISRNDADTGHRVYESIRQHNLDIPRTAMSHGAFNVEVAKAYGVDLFLSKNHDDVVTALQAGIAAAQTFDPAVNYINKHAGIHFAFDGDKVLFGGPSEDIYKAHGLTAYQQHEEIHRETAMDHGPFGNLFMKLVDLKKTFPEDNCPITLSLVTMRSDIRHFNTFEQWGEQYTDGIYVIGHTLGTKASIIEKAPILRAISADIFFDDSKRHTSLAADVVPTCYVPDVSQENVPELSAIMNQHAAKKQKDTPVAPLKSQKPSA